MVQIADPESVVDRYPHELSGGMQQRVIIAMALAADPTLLILDEPTTGLDATVEAEVLDLIRSLRARLGTSILFISHNLGVIASMCDRVGVLYAGELVEEGPAQRGAARRAAPLQRRAPALPAPRRGAQGPGPARHHPRLPARAGHADHRLRLRRPLRPGAGSLPDRASAPVRARRAAQPLPLPRGGAAAAARGAGRGGGDARDRSQRRPGRPRRRPGQDVPPVRARRARAGRGLGLALGRRDARAGGRVGKRQDHLRPHAARPRRAHRRHGRARRAHATGAPVPAVGRGRPVPADRLPEPGLRPEPPPHHPADAAPDAAQAGRGGPRPGGRAGARADAVGAAGRPLPERAAGPALGRSEAARGHRPRLRRRAARRRLRRAHLRARRVRAGRDPQPPRRAAGPPPGVLRLHLPRPGRRALPVRPHRRALPRAA